MTGLSAWDGLISSGVDGGELLIRATVILGVGSLVGAALWKGAASVRHGLWTTTFVVLLGLPVATLMGIGWNAPLLPASADVAAPMAVIDGLPSLAEKPAGTAVARPGGSIVAAPQEAAGFAAEPSTDPAAVSSAVQGAPAATRLSEMRGPSWAALWWLWAAGTVAALFSIAVGVWRARGVVRSALPIDDPAWGSALLRSKDRVGVSRNVRLLESAEVSTPMTAGWLRPVVLLPEGTRRWSAERRDMVLTHELVHIRRFDAIRQVLGQLALAPYWFHPLSWLASRLSLATRERACDEAVLALGARPSRYAGHLLDIAQDAGATPVFAALPMVQPSQLEKRIMAILGSAGPRDSVWKTALTSLLVFGLGAVAATAQPVPLGSQAAVDGPGQQAAVSLRVDPVVQDEADVQLPEVPAQEAEPLVIRGSILSTTTNPAQEMRCDIETLRGNFSGSYSSRSTGTELSGWHNGDRIIQRHVDGTRLCLRVHGDAVLDDDGRGVRAISNDGWVVLESDDGTQARLVITEGPGGMNYAWSVDGDDRAYDADAQQWTEDMFAVLDGYWEMSRLRGQVSSLRGKISSHRGHVSSLRGQISSHRGHVSSLRGKISSHRGQVSSMQGEIASLNGRVSSMSGQISSHRGQIASLRSAARATSDAQTRARLDDEIAEYEQRIEAVRREIEQFELERRVAAQERRIEDYDIEGRVAELQEEIDEYELEGRIAAIEREIQEFDLEGKIAGVEREIEDLDADRRIAEMERDLEPALEQLRRTLRRIR